MTNKHVRFISAILVAAVVAVVGAYKPAAAQSDAPVRILVKANPDAELFGTEAMVAGTASVDSLNPLGWQVVEVSAADAPALLAQLQADGRFAEVTPDYPLELTWTPDDPGVTKGTQWALNKLGTKLAWEFTTGEAITVAVLDSGIDANHPDLTGRVVTGYNFYDDNTDTTDLCGHGTHVAGIIAATADNGIGIAGIAYNAKIMPLKVIDDDCLGSYSRLMEAIIYAVDQGVRIISITSGGGYNHTGLHEAIQYAVSKGVLVVISAGNQGNDAAFYPGSYPESFTVAGTNELDGRYDKSTFGPQIDISAPATAIYSTYFHDNESTYAHMSGTSMAAPMVAGVAALILSMQPETSLEELERLLLESTVDLGTPGWDAHFGAGRISAVRAVAAITPANGNTRLGHVRVPVLREITALSTTVEIVPEGVNLTWTQASGQREISVVVYRSLVPVFEGALDIAELPVTTGSYVDTDVKVDASYYYWLIVAEENVEVETTNQFAVTFLPTPSEPTAPAHGLVYIPMVQSGN
jgi:thermitase